MTRAFALDLLSRRTALCAEFHCVCALVLGHDGKKRELPKTFGVVRRACLSAFRFHLAQIDSGGARTAGEKKGGSNEAQAHVLLLGFAGWFGAEDNGWLLGRVPRLLRLLICKIIRIPLLLLILIYS